MKKEFITALLIYLVVVFVFFYPIAKGYIPFPGDLMLNLNPYNTISFNGYAPGGVPNKAQGVDVIRELYPWKFFAIEMFKSGQIPFWNPYNFSGNPLMANFQTGAFYPLNFIFFIMPFNVGWTLFILLIPLLSAIFLYLYLRELELSKISAFYGGLVFGFSSYLVVWLQYGNIGHALIWFPLILFLTEKFIKSKNIKYLMLIIFFMTLAFLAGYIQGFFYFWAFVLVYFFVKTYRKTKFKLKEKLVFCAAVVMPFLLGAFQLLPTLELFGYSSRNNYSLDDIQKLLNPVWYAITVLVPDFFGNPASRNHFFDGTYIERVSYFGIIPFVFAIASYFIPVKKRELRLFLTFFVFSFLFSLDLIINKYIYLLPIPVISTTVPTRVLSIFVFTGAILSAFGLDYLIKKGRTKVVFYISVFIIILLLSAFFLTFINNLEITRRNLIQPLFLIIIFLILLTAYKRMIRFKYVFIFVVFGLTLFDQFRFFHKITPFSPAEYIYPDSEIIKKVKSISGLNRYWGYNQAQFVSNIQLVDKTFLPDGHDALHLRSYAQLLSASRDGKIPYAISRSDSEIVNENEGLQLKLNRYRHKLFNVLAVKYIVLKGEFIEQDDIFKEIYKSETWRIYENKQAMPRAFITDKYKVIPDKKSAIKTFYDPNFNEREYVILEEDPELSGFKLKLKFVEIVRYDPNRVIINTKTDSSAILFLSDNNYPGWHVKIDGEDSKILTSNYTFRAVKIPQGNHMVEFYYYPKSFAAGLVISGITIAIIGIIGLYYQFIYKRKN